VVKGEEVLLKIGDTPVASNGRERSKPTERVTVEGVKIIAAQENTAPATAPVPAAK
jgi:hypothetical protein